MHSLSPLPPARRALLAAAVAVLVFAPGALASVTLAPLFRDHAVLQRDQPLPVWGTANPGEKIHVEFHAQKKDTAAGPDGRWRVTLAPEPAATQAADLVVTGEAPVRVTDIVVGDLWLCSGQSNMEFKVSQAQNAPAEIAAANFPLIRQIKIPHIVNETPQATCPGEWKLCSPATAGDFTAVGFFFARDLHQQNGVPIGLINSNWGGTFIEAWMSADALKADPASAAIQERWQQILADYPGKVTAHEKAVAKWKADAAAAKAAAAQATASHADAVAKWKAEAAAAKAEGKPFATPEPAAPEIKPFTRRQPVAPEGPGSRWLPAGMWNAMIAPFVPAALKGVLWYQGEANGARASEYRTLFPGMITQWRKDFRQPNLPFYFVQLANLERAVDKTDQEWAFLREAQSGALKLPMTGQAVTIDIGNPTNIHPTNKQEVGRRLALWARAQLFDDKKIEYSGPVFAAAKAEGTTLRVNFSHASGLAAHGALGGFEIAGEDKKFVPATATIDGTAVLLKAEGVAAPVAVRYAWKNCPVASLYNEANLPASPFRSDSW